MNLHNVIRKESAVILQSQSDELEPWTKVEMSQLNQDCLIHVFQYLPIVDKIKLERVCKFWRTSSQRSWHDFKQLNFYTEVWGFKKLETVENINNRTLKKVLKRCGKYLKEITFPNSNKRLGFNVLSLVAKYCPNVSYIYAMELEIWPESIGALAENCKKIVSLSLGNCPDECDRELGLLFENNQRLQWFSVRSNYFVTGECLAKLNCESIETIVFEHCTAIELEHFNVIKNFKNLKEITINHCHDSNESIMDAISSTTSLKALTFSLCAYNYNRLSQISNLRNLEILDLSHNFSVNDRVLLSIGTHLKRLEVLDISYCDAVTNAGLSNVTNLPRLEFLYVENLEKITDQVFDVMPNLRCIDVSHCPNVGDAGLKTLIQSSHNIEFVYLNGCTKISNELLEAAIIVAKTRKNKVSLNLHVGQTKIEFGKCASDVPPLLQVIPTIFIDFL